MKNRAKWFVTASVAVVSGVVATVSLAATPVQWNMEELGKAPKVFASGYPEKDGVRSLFYEGVPYEGKPTRVFAYLALPKVAPGEKVPGLVLVHGGGGSAFRNWVKFWAEKGYAAISMDTCGSVSGDEFGDGRTGHKRHDWAGPAGWGGYWDVDKPITDQWMYHAVGAVIRANSLLRSLPEVDAERIGLTGISWGGVLTCVAAGVDKRFDFAAPVYGCGFLDEDSCWLRMKSDCGHAYTPEQFKKWAALFDPQHYLAGTAATFLWIDGSNDTYFPLSALQKSVAVPKTPYYRSTRVRMPHGHGPYAEHPQELVDFAEFRLRQIDRKTYPFVSACDDDRGIVTAGYQCSEDRFVRAELNVTSDSGAWEKRVWKSVPMTLYEGYANAVAELPLDTVAWFVSFFTEDGKCVSGELVERSEYSRNAQRTRLATKDPSTEPLPAGLDATADFTVSPGKVRPELHAASFLTRSYPRGNINDDKLVREMGLSAFRTHDAPLVNNGQLVVDTHCIFPLMNKDPKDPSNYVFRPTDHLLELNFDLGMKCLYRLGTSIEHTGVWGHNTLNPADHEKYAEVLAGIIRHYTKGWANGHKWADRMRYWELFNEPDVPPCWRGTKEEFIHLFVTCLKRLKAEFPELRIGGPAFGALLEDYMTDLLVACRKAGVTPDFLSWHGYGADPQRLLAMPARAKRLCDSLGFPNMELIIDEWHYIRNNSWDGIQGSTSPEAVIRACEGPEGATGIDSAVFTLQVETGFHDTCLSQSYFYGCGYNGVFGYVDRFRRPTKVFYGLKAVGDLIAACEDRATCRAPARTQAAFGAWTKDRTGARLIVSEFRGKPGELKVAVKGLPAGAKASVRLLNDAKDLEPSADFTWRDGLLTLKKSAPGSVIFDIRFTWCAVW